MASSMFGILVPRLLPRLDGTCSGAGEKLVGFLYRSVPDLRRQGDEELNAGLVVDGGLIWRGSLAMAVDGAGSGAGGVPGSSPADEPQSRRPFGLLLRIQKAQRREDAPLLLGLMVSVLSLRWVLRQRRRVAADAVVVQWGRFQGPSCYFLFCWGLPCCCVEVLIPSACFQYGLRIVRVVVCSFLQ